MIQKIKNLTNCWEFPNSSRLEIVMKSGMYTFTHECDNCDTIMREEQFIASNSGGIPLSLLGQMDFTCPKCGLSHYVGDIEIYNENEI